MANACAKFDFVFHGTSDAIMPTSEFVGLLRTLAKQWVFQLEKCPTSGRLHYQGRMSLIKKKRKGELITLLAASPLRGLHVMETVTANVTGFDYQMKMDTRVEGPWDDKSWKEPAYIPRQYRGLIDRVWPWQRQVLDSRQNFDDRLVNMVVDVRGCNGKSTVAALGDLHYGGIDLPPVGDHKELLQCCCDILMAKQCRDPGLVFVDLPRSLTMDVKRFSPFMTAIEQIKKGKVFEMRFHYKEWWFDSPQVWVFANHPPNLDYMSVDRWRFFTIDAFKNLRPMTKDDLCQMCQE